MIPLLLLKLRTSRTVQIGALIAIACLIAIGVYLWAASAQRETVNEATQAGRAIQQADDLHEALERTEKANAAAQEVRTDPVAKRDGCLRHSRTPANCD